MPCSNFKTSPVRTANLTPLPSFSSPHVVSLGGSVPRPELIQFLGEKVPKSVAWLTGPGVYLADVLLGSQSSGQNVLQNTINIPYPSVAVPGTPNTRNPKQAANEVEAAPLSIVLTEFHYMLLYSTGYLFAISRLTNEIVYEGRFPVRADMLAFAHDPKLRVTFAYSASQVFEIHIENEDRDVWAMYLQKARFDRPTDRPTDRPIDGPNLSQWLTLFPDLFVALH